MRVLDLFEMLKHGNQEDMMKLSEITKQARIFVDETDKWDRYGHDRADYNRRYPEILCRQVEVDDFVLFADEAGNRTEVPNGWYVVVRTAADGSKDIAPQDPYWIESDEANLTKLPTSG